MVRRLYKLPLVLFVATALLWQAAVPAVSQDEPDDPLTPAEERYYLYNWADYAYASSSHLSGNYPPRTMVDGDRTGAGWGAGTGGWADGTPNQFPDYVEVHFDREKLIHRVDVFTLQDDYRNAVEPWPEMTFGLYGLTDFNVGYFDEAANQWVYVAFVRGNNRVWRQIHFAAPVRTRKLSIVALNALSGGLPNSYSRIVEVEAWGGDALGLVTAPVKTAANPCGEGGVGPCQLYVNLLDAVKNKAQLTYRLGGPAGFAANWRKSLDWDFRRYVNARGGGGSKNIPPMAHALALWRSSNPAFRSEWDDPADAFTDPDPVAWWNKFLGCQNGTGCPDMDPAGTHLHQLLSTELFSNTYDADVGTAVVAVYHWAVRELAVGRASAPKQELLEKARAYLRHTWALYTLAAGAGPAKNIRHRANRNRAADQCQRNGNTQWYQGPFLALSGMRSSYAHLCQDDRSPLYTRAIREEWNTIGRGLPETSPIALSETDEQTYLLDYIEAQQKGWKSTYAATYPGPTLNAYALDAAQRGLLVRHIVTGDESQFLLTFLHSIKLSAVYHFLGWEDEAGKQVRLTVMESNRNGNTIPVYAVLYRHWNGLVEAALPWNTEAEETRKPECYKSEACRLSNDTSPECYFEPGSPEDRQSKCWTRPHRDDVTSGQAKLLPDDFAPTSVRARNIGPNESPDNPTGIDVHGSIEEHILNLGIPAASTGRRKYHLVFYTNQAPKRVW